MTRAFCCPTQVNRDDRRLLALAVERVYGLPCPEVVKDGNGKPYFPDKPWLWFSLSHTVTHVMVALGDVPCGCDVERERSVRPGVIRRVCADEELRDFDFLDCWVLKESFLKISGDVRMDFKRTVFSRQNGRIITPSPDVEARLYPCESCRAAVCCQGEPPETLEFVPLRELDEKFPALQ